MQQAKEAEDDLSRQLSAWEAEGDLQRQRAMWSDAGHALAGELSYGAGSSDSFGAHGCQRAASLHNLAVIGDSQDIYHAMDSNADVYAAFSGWSPKLSHFDGLSTGHGEAGVFITKEVAEEGQANDTPPAEGKDDDKDPMPAAADSVRERPVSGPREALNQGMRRLLDRASDTRSAVRRGVRRVREIVGIAYRHARHNSPLAGGDKEICEPLLEDDDCTGQEDSGRRSLKEFLEADKRLFR